MANMTTQLADQLDWHWRGHLRPRLDLTRRCGPAEGPYADHPLSELVLHINREAIHHGAEIACLRDLYLHHLTDNPKD
jgi:hypothetical protein